MEFDVIAGNPPYHKSTGTGNPIWADFVELAFENSNGYVTLVHPAIWRKPQNNRTYAKDIQPKLFEAVEYVSIHDSEEGEKAFGAGTRFDWYLANVENGNGGEMNINDENGKTRVIKVDEWPWIPNYGYKLIRQILGGESQVIHNYGAYESRASHTSWKKDSDYKHPVIHNTGEDGPKILYSREKFLGDPNHFGTSKVIFGDSIPIHNAVKDVEGSFGVGKHAIAIPTKPEKAKSIKKAIESNVFSEILNMCSWSNYQIDWRMFRAFKEDWYETVLEIEKNRNDD